MKVLVLGGTSESRTLARRLAVDTRFDVVTSLAGRTSDPRLPDGEVRVGGFGGVDGLCTWIVDNAVDVVVDATHPFAATMSANAARAAPKAGVPLVVLRRPEWTPDIGDRWLHASSAADAARIVESSFERVFLTIGRQEVGAFAGATGTWFLVRCIDPPEGPLPAHHELVSARGPFDVASEMATMHRHRIDVLVSKNSGGAMTEAKLIAARRLEVPVVMISRPAPTEHGVLAHSVEDVWRSLVDRM